VQRSVFLYFRLQAFVSLSLFNLLRFPLAMLPFMISALVEADVSRKRLTNFLLLPEVSRALFAKKPERKNLIPCSSAQSNPNNVIYTDAKTGAPGTPAIMVQNGSFSWATDGADTLSNINVDFNYGELTAVVGSVRKITF
jgi:ABC-type multidrug transport system fused ATPase/permease subunit